MAIKRYFLESEISKNLRRTLLLFRASVGRLINEPLVKSNFFRELHLLDLFRFVEIVYQEAPAKSICSLRASV